MEKEETLDKDHQTLNDENSELNIEKEAPE